MADVMPSAYLLPAPEAFAWDRALAGLDQKGYLICADHRVAPLSLHPPHEKIQWTE